MHASNEREAGAIPPSGIDYRLVFESLPGLFMVLLPDSPRFTILGVTDAFARGSLRKRESIVGLGIFEAFPDNPDNPEASGARTLQASLERVLATREPDTMAVQKYAIALSAAEGGGFEERHWSPVNVPVFAADGRIAYIVQRVEDSRLFSNVVPVTVTPSGDAGLKRGAAAPRVLLVDDSPEARAYIGALLTPHYEVEAVTDGLAALEAIRDRLPDIVLSDVMMPRLDGFGLLRQLRADPRTKPIPVILLSARAGEDASVEGMEIGADDYLMKPFSARELLARVRAHLEINRSRRHWMRELQRANEELDAFNQSVAHDLRSPLTTITGYSSILLAVEGPTLDAGQRHHLERIQAAALRMATLIDDLMSLARVNRSTMQVETVDLSQIATTVIGRLREAAPARDATVEIPASLLVKGDSRLLTIALDNLLGNAWKYSAKRSVASIELGELEENGERVFFVRDNGAGFDMAYAHKLFVPFERLHHSSEFSGTGIGLTTVRRAIERHDGRIWVTATPDEGATFFFTIDESENRHE